MARILLSRPWLSIVPYNPAMAFVRWCVRNLASTWLLALVLVVVGSGLRSTPVITGAASLLLVVTAEALRRWWHRSPWRAGFVGVGLPIIVFLLPLLNRAPVAWELAWCLLPAGVALVIEAVVRDRGWTIPEAPPGPAERPVTVMGCLVGAVVLLALTVGGCVAGMRVPVLRAEAFKNRLRPGMTAGEVAAASLNTGRHLVFVIPSAPPPEGLWLDDDGARLHGQRVTGPEAVKALVDAQVATMKLERLTFLYLSWIPVRSGISVDFGPDGRVKQIAGPFNHAD